MQTNNFFRVNVGEQFIDDNFWKINPDLKYIPEFKKLYDNLGETTSSYLMWSVWVLEDRSSNNKLGNLEVAIKEGGIKNYWKEYEDYKDTIEDYRRKYREYCMTPAHRTLSQLHQKLLERDRLISETPYKMPEIIGFDKTNRAQIDPGTIDILEKMIGTTQKFYQQYQSALELFQEEENKALIYGGRNESLSERGDI